jgi:extradiol dioxygenase family protein
LALSFPLSSFLFFSSQLCMYSTATKADAIGNSAQQAAISTCYLGPLHTRDWEPVSRTLQALSLVEKAEPVQVRFTPHLRDQPSMWMQDACKVYMDPYQMDRVS